MSTVSASVTRRPSRNSGSLPRRLHQVADLRTAAVHDDRTHADRAHEHDVLGEQLGRLAARHRSPSDRVAAVLDDDGLAPEPADVGKRLDERRSPSTPPAAASLTGTSRRSAGRSSPARPSTRLAHCTAPPDAPFTRLSIAAITMHPAGARVEARGEVRRSCEPSVALVDGEHRPHDDERLVAYAARQAPRAATRWSAWCRRGPGVAGGQDAAVHRREVRREQHLTRRSPAPSPVCGGGRAARRRRSPRRLCRTRCSPSARRRRPTRRWPRRR